MSVKFFTDLRQSSRRNIFSQYQLYLLCLPAITYLVIFHYIPMYGVQIAFRNYTYSGGFWGSPFVGLLHFQRFFNSYHFFQLLYNTISISIYNLVMGFPLPIVLALILNHTANKHFKKVVQTVTYAPHFISVVVLCGMIGLFLSPSSGIINYIIKALGGEGVHFMADPNWFRHIYVWSDIWQHTGWGAIIYIAALSGINVELYEASKMDGASRLQTIRYVDLPGIIPTAVLLLIMRLGSIMNVGFQKAFLLQTDANLQTSEIIATYVYKVGLIQAQYSFSTAVDLFNTFINVILLVIANNVSKRLSETSLW